MIVPAQITWTDADAAWQLDDLEVPHYTENEIELALATGTLTADHCLYLHTQRINWQVHVKVSPGYSQRSPGSICISA